MPNPPELLDRRGHRITELDIQKSMRTNIIAGVLGMTWTGMALNYTLTLFMEAIGASGVMIGLLLTVRQVVIAVQVPAALYFESLPEHLGSRKRWWAIPLLAHRLAWFAVGGLALCWKPGAGWLPFTVVVVVGVSDLLAQTGAPLWFSWMADLIPHKTGGQFWGRRQSIVTLGALFGMAAAGFLLDAFRVPATGKTSAAGFALVFTIAAAFGAADILLHLKVKEPRRAPIAPGGSMAEKLLAPLQNRDFLRFTLCMGAFYAAISVYSPFSIVYLKRDFPVTYSHIAALNIAGSLGAVLTGFSVGRRVDRLGPRVLAALLILIVPCTALIWFFVQPTLVTLQLPWLGAWIVPQVILIQLVASFIAGAAFSAMFPCQVRLAALLSNNSGRTMAMGVHWAIIGLLASLGSMLGGSIMDWFKAHPLHYVFPTGTSFSFLHVSIGVFALLLWGVCLPLLLSIRTPVDKVPFGKAVSWIVQPFNVVRSLASLRCPQEDEEEKEDAQTRR